MLHLIHPFVVHFAIAFLATGSIVEAYGSFRHREGAIRFGSTLVVSGTVALVLAIVTGYLALNTVEVPSGAEEEVGLHERSALILLGVYLVGMLWKGWYRGELPAEARPYFGVYLLATLVFLGMTAYFGGELVYGYGVGVLAGDR